MGARVAAGVEDEAGRAAADHLGLEHRVGELRRVPAAVGEDLAGALVVALEVDGFGDEMGALEAEDDRAVEAARAAQDLGALGDDGGRRRRRAGGSACFPGRGEDEAVEHAAGGALRAHRGEGVVQVGQDAGRRGVAAAPAPARQTRSSVSSRLASASSGPAPASVASGAAAPSTAAARPSAVRACGSRALERGAVARGYRSAR